MNILQKGIWGDFCEDRPPIEAILQRTQQRFPGLLDTLDPKKYPKAHTYIENLINPLGSSTKPDL
jgi:hypothetical protein